MPSMAIPPSRNRKKTDGRPLFDRAVDMHNQVSDLIRSGKVRSAHDVSDDGLAVAIAEMCIASNLGATIEITAESYRHSIFAPIATTYVLEMSEADATASRLPIIGRVEKQSRFRLTVDPEIQIDLPVDELADAWRTPLAQGGGR